MERDYLALRNNYNIDDEDVGLTLSGYSKNDNYVYSQYTPVLNFYRK